MSEPIGETFVTITPLVNEAQFKAQAESQITAATASLKAVVPLTVQQLQSQIRGVTSGFPQAAATGDASLLASLRGQSEKLQQEFAELTAKGGGAVGALTSDFEALFAAEAQATQALNAYNAGLTRTAVVTAEVAVKEQARSRTLRDAIRSGQGFSPIDVGRFAVAGLAIGAVFQGLQHLQEGLKVTGDEALTFEGKMRNAGAAILSGDVVGAFLALNAHAKSTAEQLDDLKKSAETTPVDFRNIAAAAGTAAAELQSVADAQKRVGDTGESYKVIRNAAADLREAAAEATALGNALEASVTAAQDVGAAIAAAGSEAAAFGERTRGTGGATAGGRGDTGTTGDSTDTEANRAATARARAARTKGLQDDLAEARKEEAAAKAAQQNQKGIVEGRAERARAVAEAEANTARVESQIAAEQDRARKEAAAEAKRRAAEAKREADERARAAKEAAATAHRALLDDIQYDLELAQIGLRRAQLTEKTVADDIRAEQKIIAILKRAAATKGLTKEERRGFEIELANARIDLAGIKNPKSSGGGFGLNDLFNESVSNFDAFGSNIAGRNGVLSGQDARAAFAVTAGRNALEQLGTAQLTEAQRQTALLEVIAGKRNGSPVLAGKGQGNPLDLYGAEIAASYGFGVN